MQNSTAIVAFGLRQIPRIIVLLINEDKEFLFRRYDSPAWVCHSDSSPDYS